MNATSSSAGHRRRAVILALPLGLALVAMACTEGSASAGPVTGGGDVSTDSVTGSDSSTNDDPDGPVPSTSTTDEPTTASPSTAGPTTEHPSTTAPTSTTKPKPTTAPTSVFEPVADGSGCVPGSDQLADGRWFGYAADAAADEFEFDLACWFSGEAAVVAAAQDGRESPPPNDYYVRNTSATLRVLRVGDDTPVSWYPSSGDPTTGTDTDYRSWRTERSDPGPGVWVTVSGGRVSAIAEQWTP